mmetsp:Transcript_31883/g.101712  ORF Transcript_31883/g.101712 Transcript_31883/m.101712 type:complete len:206 (-) Transcript_31883:926-1543(-)
MRACDCGGARGPANSVLVRGRPDAVPDQLSRLLHHRQGSGRALRGGQQEELVLPRSGQEPRGAGGGGHAEHRRADPLLDGPTETRSDSSQRHQALRHDRSHWAQHCRQVDHHALRLRRLPPWQLRVDGARQSCKGPRAGQLLPASRLLRLAGRGAVSLRHGDAGHSDDTARCDEQDAGAGGRAGARHGDTCGSSDSWSRAGGAAG